MAKTLMYVPGSPTSVKLGDTDTDLYLQVAKDNVNVDLTSVKSITVKIADANKNYLKDISITPSNLTSGNNGILTVPLNSDNIGGLNSGDYYFEVWIVTADSETEIYPDMNVTKFHVFNNLVGGTTILTTLTMQAFLDRITSTQTASETSLSNSQTALANANTANTNAAKALSDLKAGNYLTKDTLSNAPSFEALQTQVNNSAVGANLVPNSNANVGQIVYGNNCVLGKHSFYNGGTSYLNIIHNTKTSELTSGSSRFYITPGKTYTLSFKAFNNGLLTSCDVWLLGRPNSNTTDYYTVAQQLVREVKFSTSAVQYYTVTFTVASGIENAHLRFDNNGTSTSGSSADLYFNEVKIEAGSVATPWCPAASEIANYSQIQQLSNQIATDYAKIKAAIVALGGSLS